MKKNCFIILDRDGVINLDSAHYIKTPEEWLPIPHSLNAIATLTQLGYHIIIASNQSGLARGYYDLETLELIHQKMQLLVRQAGGEISAIFFCPHGPDDNCVCRKPAAGLYDSIKSQYPHINFNQTYSVGDSLRDLQAAQKAGCLPVLVKTGNGQKTLEKINLEPHLAIYTNIPIFDNLWSFSEFLRQ